MLLIEVIAMHDDEFDISALKQLGNHDKDEILSRLRKKQRDLDSSHEQAQIESQHGLDYLFDDLDNLD
ncbi:hypothetical protein AAEU28_08945 [Pseudoalteromonas sp. SS15]|uniref:hypothetical protein n=1 Tax=Pseudoalteromonas sp. SS15 TaxID=3139393 RepID=UPI003BAB8C4E